MFCKNCGKEMPDGTSFCTECGTPQDKVEASAPTTPPVPPATPPAPPVEQAAPAQTPVTPPAGQGAPPPPIPPAAGAPFIEAPKRRKTGLIIGVVGLVVLLAVAVVLVVVLLGSSDTSQATKLINKAAPFMTDVQTKGTTLETDLSSLLNNLGNIASSAQYETEANKIRAEIKDINSDLNNAQKYISQVSSLSGVQHYKDFAVVVATLIRTNLKETGLISDYLNYLGTQFKAVEAGQTVDSKAIAARTAAFLARLKELGAEATSLKDKADKIKTDNHLG